MEEDIKIIIKNYHTTPFDSLIRTRPGTISKTTWTSIIVRRQWLLTGVVSMYEWYWHMYKRLCSISWVSTWDDHWVEGIFPEKIWTGCTPHVLCSPSFSQGDEGDLGKSHHRILNHGLIDNNSLLEKGGRGEKRNRQKWNIFFVHFVLWFNYELNLAT